MTCFHHISSYFKSRALLSDSIRFQIVIWKEVKLFILNHNLQIPSQVFYTEELILDFSEVSNVLLSHCFELHTQPLNQWINAIQEMNRFNRLYKLVKSPTSYWPTKIMEGKCFATKFRQTPLIDDGSDNWLYRWWSSDIFMHLAWWIVTSDDWEVSRWCTRKREKEIVRWSTITPTISATRWWAAPIASVG